MTVDFGALLYNSLPGLYRDQDIQAELRRFLEIAAGPLTELHGSVSQLHADFYATTCQPALIALIGGLVGADVDTSLPERAQRAQVLQAVRSYREKGTAPALLRHAEQLTGWRVVMVDASERLARLPYVDALDPVVAIRDQPVGQLTPGGAGFLFRPDPAPRPLFDALTGRPITRQALAGHEADYAGGEGRFTIAERGIDLFTGDPPYTAVTADLSDLDVPRTLTGAPLALGTRQVAVDPTLGRFRIEDPLPLAGNLRVTFHSLDAGTVRPQTFAVTDPAVTARLGRSDDPAPYTVDVGTPRRLTDRTGRAHFDVQAFFCTPAVVATGRRPTALPAGPAPPAAAFSVDDRPLEPGAADGVPLQLLDGIDASPLTRTRLAGRPADFCGTPLGFTIRIRGVDVCGPAFPLPVRMLAADLSDPADPRRPDGTPLVLTGTEIAVDPQTGRFLADLAALGAATGELTVDYLLGLATAVTVPAEPLPDRPPELVAATLDGRAVRCVDGLDGTPIAALLALGVPVSRFHGTPRGWRIHRNGADVSGSFTAVPTDLGDAAPPGPPVPTGTVAVDPDRGRFRFPPGVLAAGDRIAVHCSAADPAVESPRFDSLAQHLPRALPAAVVPVVVDTRRRPVDPANLR